MESLFLFLCFSGLMSPRVNPCSRKGGKQPPGKKNKKQKTKEKESKTHFAADSMFLSLSLSSPSLTHKFLHIYTYACWQSEQLMIRLSISLFFQLTFSLSHTHAHTQTHRHTRLRLFGAAPSLCYTEEAGVNYRAKQELKRWTTRERRRNWTPSPHTHAHTKRHTPSPPHTPAAATTTHLCSPIRGPAARDSSVAAVMAA